MKFLVMPLKTPGFFFNLGKSVKTRNNDPYFVKLIRPVCKTVQRSNSLIYILLFFPLPSHFLLSWPDFFEFTPKFNPLLSHLLFHLPFLLLVLLRALLCSSSSSSLLCHFNPLILSSFPITNHQF